jgi:hypothetical protein
MDAEHAFPYSSTHLTTRFCFRKYQTDLPEPSRRERIHAAGSLVKRQLRNHFSFLITVYRRMRHPALPAGRANGVQLGELAEHLTHFRVFQDRNDVKL